MDDAEEPRSTWDDIRRLADELELEIHLAGMDARDRWRALKPRVVEIEQRLTEAGKRAGEVVDRELALLGAALRRLRDELR